LANLTTNEEMTRAVIGTPEEHAMVEALMHFFDVEPVDRSFGRRWPTKAVDAVGAVLNLLPAAVRGELVGLAVREYGAHKGVANDGPYQAESAWLPQAKDFAVARFQFLIDSRIH
jgi:hypothetical protein